MMLLLERKDPLTARTVGGMTDWIGVDVKKNTSLADTGKDDRCGTDAGHTAHRYRNERPCVECRFVHNEKKRQRRLANSDREKAQALIYRQTHPEKVRVATAKWRNEHPEKVLAYGIKYREENAIKIKEYEKKYLIENPEMRLKINRARRALKHNVLSEPYTSQQILNFHGTDCHICSEPIDLNSPRTSRGIGWERGLHLDHVIPLSKGGSDLIENVKPSHAKCNLRKNAKTVETGRG